MLLHVLLGGAVRVAVLLGLTLGALPLLRRASSATRRLVLATSLGGALVLPLVSAAAPSWRVRAPEAVASLRAVVVAEPLGPAGHPAALSGPARPAPLSSPRGEAGAPFDPTALVATLWALGAAVVLARLLVGLGRTRRIVLRATPAHGWSVAAARAGRATGQRVEVRTTRELDAPAVAGVLRPVILVPDASASWTDERRYAVLLHELAHVRQRDCLAQRVAQVACAAHWFDPLVWLAARRLRCERELAADDAVVAAGARASSYAEDLLAIASAGVAPREVPSGALGMAERSLIAARVTAIVSARRLRRPPTPAVAALLVASVGAGVLAVACATPETVAATKSDPSTTPVATPAAPPARASLNPRIQAIAEDELGQVMDLRKAAAGVVLVLDPSTGEVLANAGRAHGAAADVALQSAYTPGSTMKAFTLAAALEEGVVTPTERFDCEHGSWRYQGATIEDAHENGWLTVSEMLAVSSNVGFVKIYDRLGGGRLDRWLRAFHFGAAPLEGATAGSMPARVEERSAAGAAVAFGGGITVSPLQLAAAYGALANGGVYVPPTLRRRTGAAPREVIMKPETARTVVALLEHVVGDEHATGTAARVDGQRVAGKTGTAVLEQPDGSKRYYSSFVGIVPATSPRFVILVGLDQAGEDETGGGVVAAPVFARVATRALGR